MRKNDSKQEIEQLILELSSQNQEVSDFAMQVLMHANSYRHLADLIEALEFGDDLTKQKIWYKFTPCFYRYEENDLRTKINDF